MRPHHYFRLFLLSLIGAGYGIHLIKRGIEGDTLLPGTSFTRVPRWLFFTVGLALQIPALVFWVVLRNAGFF